MMFMTVKRAGLALALLASSADAFTTICSENGIDATASTGGPDGDDKLNALQIGKLFAAAKKWHGMKAATLLLEGLSAAEQVTADAATEAFAAAAAEGGGSVTPRPP